MQLTMTAAFNIQPDGAIVTDGDHAPGVNGPVSFDAIGIAVSHRGPGDYLITGPGIALPDGWRATAYRDENDALTSKLQLTAGADGIAVLATDPATGVPKDITYLLTLRVAVTVDYVVPETASEPVV